MQYNIYFRKEVWELFKDEPKKSELVNRVLKAYYKQYPKAKDAVYTEPELSA